MNKTILHHSIRFVTYSLVIVFLILIAKVTDVKATDPLKPLMRTVDMDLGEIVKVELHDGSTAELELMDVEPITDSVMDAVREVHVTVRVNGHEKTIRSGNYQLPVTVGGVQIDCPVTLDYMERSHIDWWGLEKDARLRVWPAGSPYIWPGTFVYPVDQNWLASLTWYSNEPVSSPRPSGEIYYHAGLDLGGAEDMVEVYAATDGVLVAVGDETLSGETDNFILGPRYDVVYIRDSRGWYYRYSHFDWIDPVLQPGQRVFSGQKLGMLGKEGGSGGWSHLHFHIVNKKPSGSWGIQDGYAFLWQAYRRQFDPEILAVARPHKAVHVGEATTLSAANSWAKQKIQSYEWTLSDGLTSNGMEIKRTYEQPGMYSEIVKVTDTEGNYDYDFATVIVFEEESSGENGPPRIHAAYYPTKDIAPGDKVFFQVRARGTTEGFDVWNFDDGSDPVTVKSNIDPGTHAKVGYSTTSHRFEVPGDYLVKVHRKTSHGTATTHLYVKVRR